MRFRFLGLAAYLIALLAGAAAYAQHTDASFTTTSEDCAGVHWSADVLRKYPDIVPACQSVEHHNGVEYVKFSGTVVRVSDQGKRLTLDLKDGGIVTIDMPEKTKLSMDGRPTPPSKLVRGDKLNFYVPQSRAVAQFYAQEQKMEEAPAIQAPIEVAAPKHEPEPERVAATLPSTASNLPIVGIAGAALILLGAALTVARRRNR